MYNCSMNQRDLHGIRADGMRAITAKVSASERLRELTPIERQQSILIAANIIREASYINARCTRFTSRNFLFAIRLARRVNGNGL